MTLSDPRALMKVARAERLGIGAFNIVTLEHAEAIIAGATRTHSPVVLQLSENSQRNQILLTHGPASVRRVKP